MGKNLQKIISFAVAVFITSSTAVFAAESLIPLGMPIGIKIYADGIIVAGISNVQTAEKEYSPASESGVKPGDIIVKINGNSIRTTEQLEQILNNSDGSLITADIIRNGMEKTINIPPALSAEDNRWHIGAWVRDSMAGIGTVSFVDPETGDYGALGHAVCDIDSGQLIPLYKGSIMPATITDVKKGLPGTPGELHGSFDLIENIGSIEKNTPSGIFGNITNKSVYENQKAYPIGKSDDIHEGSVKIISTVEGAKPKEYFAEITKIYKDKTNNEKNMLIKITDEKLLQITGGIVQGMSGSPIVQDGKLIGAVTHVLVNNPQKGYGIFIENMLEKAENSITENNAA